MFPSHAFLPLILIASTAVDATPVSRTTGKTTLSFTTKINRHGSGNVVERDRDRILAMKDAGQRGERSSTSFSVQNANLYYTARVGVGSPPTDYTLLIDTGSSNTWVGAHGSYVKTSTSRDTGHTVSVRYGSGSFSGEERSDTVTLAPGLVIEQQSIGVANHSSGFSVDGILGVGPVDLTRGSVSGVDTVPTVTDNLLSQGTISEEVLGIYFTPAATRDKTGELTFGGVDYSVITSPVFYAPLTTTFPASFYWGINQTVTYGDTTLLRSDAGIVDTGSTLIYLASDAFQRYRNMTGATMDSATGFLRITPDQYEDLEDLTFIIDHVPFVLTRNAQIWPRSLNTVIGGDTNGIYLVIAGLGWPSGSGFDFVDGYAFLERYYSVYDATNSRVGFAFTDYTFSRVN